MTKIPNGYIYVDEKTEEGFKTTIVNTSAITSIAKHRNNKLSIIHLADGTVLYSCEPYLKTVDKINAAQESLNKEAFNDILYHIRMGFRYS